MGDEATSNEVSFSPKVVGSIVRTGIIAYGAYKLGQFNMEVLMNLAVSSGEFVAAAATVLGGLLWSLWQKWKDHKKLIDANRALARSEVKLGEAREEVQVAKDFAGL
jgi:hypothetical protein